MENLSRLRGVAAAALACSCVIIVACVDNTPTGTLPAAHLKATSTVAAVECTASVITKTVSCAAPKNSSGSSSIRSAVLGGQNNFVKLTSSNVSYNSGTQIFQFDLTVQNLNNEAIGTPDGIVADPEGIQVYFAAGPTVTSGTGSISVANGDGIDAFTGPNQPFFAYHEILAQNQVSSARTWQLNIPASATQFTFGLLIETDIQYLLVINEVLVNPAGTTMETNGDWVEIYNAGTHSVNLQGLVIADSAASGRRPYHLVNDTTKSLVVAPGAYFVFGTTTTTANNGGVPVDYAWGGSVSLASSLDAFKIARIYGTDTLTIDRTQYASAATSAQDGISRELKNPALDNSNMDGSNWGSASVTSVYGTGGRGTPKQQNSDFTPDVITDAPVVGNLLTGMRDLAPDRRRRSTR